MLPMDEVFTFDQKFEMLGRFWPPQFPERKTTGLFRGNGEAVELLILDDLAPERIPILHGEMPNGMKITLFDCSVWHEWTSASEDVRLKLRPAAILEGWHAPGPDELSLSRFECTFERLEEWMDLRPFKTGEDSSDPPGQAMLTGSISYALPELFNIDIDASGLNVSTGGSMVHGGGDWSSTEYRLTHHASIRFRAMTPQTLRQCIEHAETFSQLLSLMRGAICRPRLITADAWETRLFGQGELPEDIRVSWQRLSRPTGERFVHGLTHAEIVGDFPTLLRQWYADSQLLQSPRRTFFATMESPPSFTAPLFLLLMQALEGHCLATDARTFLGNDEWANLSSQLVAVVHSTVEGNARQALADRISHLNRKSLRHHIEQQWKRLSPAVRQLIAQEIEGFPAKIVDTRNYLTHLLEGENPLGPFLVMSIESVTNLLIALMLMRSGLPERHVQALLERRPRLLTDSLVWHLY